MIALAASIVLALYLLIPSSIFRLVFGLFVPLRSFVRTRGEEIFQGVMSVVAPLILALVFVWTCPPFQSHPFSLPDTPQLRRADYELVVGALYSDAVFRENHDAFWKALMRTGRRQGRFLSWYYLLVIGEGCLFGTLCVYNPRLRKFDWYRWMFNKVLLPSISEWHVLLTPFFFRDKGTVVWADILCTDNTLYRGRIAQHSLDREGNLGGLIITEAKRYARDAYLKDKEKGSVKKEDYWRPIPGAKLYIFAGKILNLNLTYEGRELPPQVIADVISRLLKEAVVIEMKPSPEKPTT